MNRLVYLSWLVRTADWIPSLPYLEDDCDMGYKSSRIWQVWFLHLTCLFSSSLMSLLMFFSASLTKPPNYQSAQDTTGYISTYGLLSRDLDSQAYIPGVFWYRCTGTIFPCACKASVTFPAAHRITSRIPHPDDSHWSVVDMMPTKRVATYKTGSDVSTRHLAVHVWILAAVISAYLPNVDHACMTIAERSKLQHIHLESCMSNMISRHNWLSRCGTQILLLLLDESVVEVVDDDVIYTGKTLFYVFDSEIHNHTPRPVDLCT